jgi:hypothetical protein
VLRNIFRKLYQHSVKSRTITMLVLRNNNKLGKESMGFATFHAGAHSRISCIGRALHNNPTLYQGKRFLWGSLCAGIISVGSYDRPARTPEHNASRHGLASFPVLGNVNYGSNLGCFAHTGVVNNHIAHASAMSGTGSSGDA